jgi:hypothetical protein
MKNPAAAIPFFLFILAINGWAGVGEGRERPVRTSVGGVPVYSFGHTYILGQPPDLLPGVILQAGNDHPTRKIRLKKSWEIKKGWVGGSSPHMPRTEMMDRFQSPYLSINLIDGDPETYWCSRGQPVAGMEPAWIRLDLPQDASVSCFLADWESPRGSGRGRRNSW